MCGIIGSVVGSDKKYNKLKNSLFRIYENQQTRGKQGAGFSRLKKESTEIDFKRFKNPSEMFKEFKEKILLNKGDLILLHHRTPTCTSNEPELNHPLTGEDGFVSLIHNGSVWNAENFFEEYKDEIQTIEQKGKHTKYTDSEIIRILIEEEIRKNDEYDDDVIVKAIKETCKKIKGNFAIAFTVKGDNGIWLFKNGNPLLVYQDNRGNWLFSSEYPKGFGRFGEATSFVDGQIAKLTENGLENINYLTTKEVDEMRTIKQNKSSQTLIDEEYYDGVWTVHDETSRGIISMLSTYYDKLGNRINRLEEANETRNQTLLGKPFYEYFFTNVSKEDHPLLNKAWYKITSRLADLVEANKLDKELMKYLLILIRSNVYGTFKRLTEENFYLLRQTLHAKAKSSAVIETVKYIQENSGYSDEFAEFYEYVDDEYNRLSLDAERHLGHLKQRMFCSGNKNKLDLSRKEVKSIGVEPLSKYFNQDKNEDKDIETEIREDIIDQLSGDLVDRVQIHYGNNEEINSRRALQTLFDSKEKRKDSDLKRTELDVRNNYFVKTRQEKIDEEYEKVLKKQGMVLGL